MDESKVLGHLAGKLRTKITNSWWNEVGENVLQWMRIDGSESHRGSPLVVLLVNMLVQPAHTKTLCVFPFQRNIKLFLKKLVYRNRSGSGSMVCRSHDWSW